jgi:energy-coupling factor transporter ATP-binding protein EcfA2
MLRSAKFHNFTTLPNSEWHFSPGLNVIVGENGVGKSHVLKVIYSLLKIQSGKPTEQTKAMLEKAYADKLVGVMRPESIGRLVKRRQGRDRCDIRLEMQDEAKSCEIAFATNAKSQVEVVLAPRERLELSPVYLPTRELVTLCPWFVPLFDNFHLEFEETWRDTVSLLGAPSVKGPREKKVALLLAPLEAAMGGKVSVDTQTGRFYLHVPSGKMEMPLVAEGMRKLAMLARLISTGVLLEQGYLFWDEPETNLNPKLIKIVARSILQLANSGIQIFIATHSLFLLREIDALTTSRQHKTQCRYFALKQETDSVALEQGDRIDDLQTLVLLDEELAQSDRFVGEENGNGHTTVSLD